MEQFIGHQRKDKVFTVNHRQVKDLFTDEFLFTPMKTFHDQKDAFKTLGGQCVTAFDLQDARAFHNEDNEVVKCGFYHEKETTPTDKIVTAMSHCEHPSRNNEFVLCSGDDQQVTSEAKVASIFGPNFVRQLKHD